MAIEDLVHDLPPQFTLTALGNYLCDPSEANKEKALAELRGFAELNQQNINTHLRSGFMHETTIDAQGWLNDKYGDLRYQIISQDAINHLDALKKELVKESGSKTCDVTKNMMRVVIFLSEHYVPREPNAQYYQENLARYQGQVVRSFYEQQSTAIGEFANWATEKVMDGSKDQGNNTIAVSHLVGGMRQRLDTFVREKGYETQEGREAYQRETAKDVRESKISVTVLQNDQDFWPKAKAIMLGAGLILGIVPGLIAAACMRIKAGSWSGVFTKQSEKERDAHVDSLTQQAPRFVPPVR